ncbi:MAG: histidine kinase [Rhodocyclaceae bacterium]|nr:histidine kinase [Rhodocyclaceae bacterium]
MALKDESIRQFTEAPATRLSGRFSVLTRLRRRIERWPLLRFVAVVAATTLVYSAAVRLGIQFGAAAWALIASALAAAAAIDWRGKGEPEAAAMNEARLMALTARIRPHFLYNSLNAILGTIRNDPRAAETALEEMAELFRALMNDPRQLTPLSDEIALCRKYLALERLRLGDRVQVQWDIDNCPPDALVPPLMLQPLLENAVYHGVEPMSQPAPIAFRLIAAGRMLVIELSNAHEAGNTHERGNRMALANIRERLEIYYGLAAYLNAEMRDGRYTVRIVVPYESAAR